MLFSYVWEQQLLDQLTNNTWSYNHNTILQQSVLLIVEQLMKSIVTKLLTDITTSKAVYWHHYFLIRPSLNCLIHYYKRREGRIVNGCKWAEQDCQKFSYWNWQGFIEIYLPIVAILVYYWNHKCLGCSGVNMSLHLQGVFKSDQL